VQVEEVEELVLQILLVQEDQVEEQDLTHNQVKQETHHQ
jgi:hypothetical protein